MGSELDHRFKPRGGALQITRRVRRACLGEHARDIGGGASS